VPITFIIEIVQEKSKLFFLESFYKFMALYKLLHFSTSDSEHEKNEEEKELLPLLKDGDSTKYTMPSCHFVGKNLWIMKPTGMNRGNGIHIFKDIPKLMQLIKECLITKIIIRKHKTIKKEGIDQDNAKTKEGADTIKDNTKPNNEETIKAIEEQPNKLVKRKFIIQKYIESPLLINERKFDIRVWVLITEDFNAYLFKEGYIRTSSSPFVIDLNDVDNKFVHLTNNAIQKHGQNYGKFEDGNQLSFTQFQNYIDLHYPGKKMSEDIIPEMKNIIRKSILATKKNLNPENRKHTFEIFGYDFIIDSDFNLWLIEVNTNPCLEESSNLLKMLLPRMIDDALKLTVDVIFPPHSESSQRKVYPVEGYDDKENIW